MLLRIVGGKFEVYKPGNRIIHSQEVGVPKHSDFELDYFLVKRNGKPQESAASVVSLADGC
jgi:hypothetical protein